MAYKVYKDRILSVFFIALSSTIRIVTGIYITFIQHVFVEQMNLKKNKKLE